MNARKPVPAAITSILKEESWPSPIESAMMGNKWGGAHRPVKGKNNRYKEDWR